ncbi:MAG: SPOR domain-containing protein [Desulfobacteraceae bacterium]|nr:SPOR domain-containing protein [Desulfobacteraceae bacterium]
MIWILRHISVHIWLATLFTIPLCFYILPGLTRFFPGINSITAGFVTMITIILGLGFFMDIIAKKMVMSLIKEGQAWERSGILTKAEKSFIKALRIYDTFLLWPFSAKKSAQKISGAIAKFKLNTSIENQHFKLATLVYLKMNPEDVDIVELWLEQVQKSAIVSSIEQEVLSILAEEHHANKSISAQMANIFIGLERKDFTAKKLYQRVKKEPVFEKTDSKETESLLDESNETIQKDVSFIQQERKPRKKIEIKKYLQSFIQRCILFSKWLLVLTGSVLSFIILSASKVFGYIKEHEKAQFYLKIGLLTIVSIWLVFFMISTMSHLFKSKTIEKEKAKIQIQVSKPFTIQVAAYLKKTHAERYADTLKKKGIDAKVKMVNGGGKTWFVVHVSEFAGKKNAAAYGKKLKQQKIIDDFFVNNK